MAGMEVIIIVRHLANRIYGLGLRNLQALGAESEQSIVCCEKL